MLNSYYEPGKPTNKINPYHQKPDEKSLGFFVLAGSGGRGFYFR